MLTRSDIPYGLTAGVNGIFFNALNSWQGSMWQEIATVVPSSKDQETYSWLGSLPNMREFTDERVLKSLKEFGYTIKNKKWESTIAIDRDALEDEQYGQIRARITQLAQAVQVHKDQLVFGLLSEGFSGLAYDGAAFFGTHVVGGTNYVNKGTAALSATSLAEAISFIKSVKDEEGRPYGFIPDLLVVHPSNEWVAREILQSSYAPVLDNKAANTPTQSPMRINVMQGALRLLVSPYLTDSNDWFVLSTNGVLKPIIFQERTPIEFTAMETDSDGGFMRDTFMYGVRQRYNVGYGMWQGAYGASVT